MPLVFFQNIFKKMKKYFFVIVAYFVFAMGNELFAEEKEINIVILGSSTAEGYGPTIKANAWVSQYRQYVQSINMKSTVTNLAKDSFSTYHIMPGGHVAPAGRPSPDNDRNITKALSFNPDVIIINLPSNDATKGYPVSEQISNYKQIVQAATDMKVPVFITTPQPRNLSEQGRQNLMDMRDSTFSIYGEGAIDFWVGIANEDGTVKSIFDMGDGIHLNDSAHTVLKDRVVDADVLAYSGIHNYIDTINIDFGSIISGAGWNNFESATQQNHQYLINSLFLDCTPRYRS